MKPHIAIIHNKLWQARFEEQVRMMFPEEWRSADPEEVTLIGMQLRDLHVNWRDSKELLDVFYNLYKIGWIEIEMNADQSKMRYRRYSPPWI